MKEQLSAYLDGEFEDKNADHLIANMKVEGEMRDAWQTYHLIGDVMRGERMSSDNLSDRIMQAIDEEPTMFAPNTQATPAKPEVTNSEKTPVIWSIAASVAAVFFVGLMLLQDQNMNSQDPMAVEMADNETTDYLEAHQKHAPSSAAYFIENASFSD